MRLQDLDAAQRLANELGYVKAALKALDAKAATGFGGLAGEQYEHSPQMTIANYSSKMPRDIARDILRARQSELAEALAALGVTWSDAEPRSHADHPR